MLQQGNVLKKCNSRFQEIYEAYSTNSKGKIIVSHFGEFSQDLVNSLSTGVEELMLNSGDKKGVVKRMFSILVEGLQNIRIHGSKDEFGNQISFLLVIQEANKYKVVFSNLVDEAHIKKVVERIDTLNNLEIPQIKEMYMEVLSNGIMSNKGGAGLGFITMALKSKNKINYKSEKITEGLYNLIVELTIDRVNS
jgi:hypothetical protein